VHNRLPIILIILLLIPFISVVPNYVNANNSFREVLNVYSYGTVSLFDLKIYDHPIIVKNINSTLNFIPDNTSFTIAYYNIPSWESNYNYLLSGVEFSETPLKEIPYTHMSISLNVSSINKNIKNSFDSIFRTYFFKNGSRLIGYTDYSIFKKFINTIISSSKYTRFLSWIDPQNFSPKNDIFVIKILKNETDIVFNIIYLKDYRVKFFYWTLGKFINFKSTAPKIGYNYTSILNIFFKDVFIENIPKNYTKINIDNANKLFIYRFDIKSGVEFKDVRFKIRYETPLILIERVFNSTDFINGAYIEVRLNIINLMQYPISNFTVKESPWWGSGIKFVSGETEKIYSKLEPNIMYTFSYVVKIDASNKSIIFIRPAIGILKSATSLTQYIYSNTNIIYINYKNAPFIEAIIKHIDTRYIEIGKSIKYTAEISNKGKSSVDSVIFGEYVIGRLNPGDVRKIELSSSHSIEGSLNTSIGIKALYKYNGFEYSLYTQRITTSLYPRVFNRPWLSIRYNYKNVAQNNLNISIWISNEGLYNVKDLMVKVNLFNSTYIEGNFSKTNLVYENNLLMVNHTIDIYGVFKYNKPIITRYPVIIIKSPSLVSRYISGFKYFSNAINISRTLPKSPYLINYNYTFEINVTNYGDAYLYNLSITITQPKFNLTSTNMSTPIVEPYQNKSFSIGFISHEVGNFSISDIKFSYWYLGSYTESTIEGGNFSFYKGLWLSIKVPKSVEEGSKFNMTISVASDIYKLIKNVNISITLPSGLEFADGSIVKNLSINLTSNLKEFNLVAKALKPGKYQVKSYSASYLFNGLKAKYVPSPSEYVSISVRENVIIRYWVYFIPMLIIGIAYGLWLRKSLYKKG